MLKRIKGFTLIELLIVVAIIAILAAIAVPNFLEAQTRSKVARVQADLRSLATGVESYYVDNNQYPMMDSSVPGTTSGFGANQIPGATSGLMLNPTFRNKKDANDALHTMTTPISYITSYFSDPFADTKRATFEYSRGSASATWLMWSFGPDTDEKAGNPGLAAAGGDIAIDFSHGAYPQVTDTTYNPSIKQPTDVLISTTYDPTNGTTSNGDVWRAKQ